MSNLATLINFGAALANELELEPLAIGPGEDNADSALELAGRHLLYRVAIYGNEVRLGAGLMDAAAAPETLLRSPNTAAGWQTVKDVVNALEVHEVKSLERPIKAWDGYDGANGFVIG